MSERKHKNDRRKRRTTFLREVIGTDLLTWKEKMIQGQSSGLYSLTNEQAYFRVPGDKAEMPVPEFQRKLREDIDANFTVVFNSAVSSEEHILQGHTIYFYVEPYDGYIQVMNVGRNADNILPANSVGKVVKYHGEAYERGAAMDEEPILYRGWVAAYEGCKNAYEKWNTEGISPAMCINPKEIFKLREAFKIVNFKDTLNEAKNQMDDILHAPVVIEPIEEEEVKTEEIQENGSL